MTAEEQQKIRGIIEDSLKPRMRQQFINGCIAGFNSGLASAYVSIKDMTSAKQIKEALRLRVKESQDGLHTNIVDTGDAHPDTNMNYDKENVNE